MNQTDKNTDRFSDIKRLIVFDYHAAVKKTFVQ